MGKAIYKVHLVSTTPIAKEIVVQVNERRLEDLRAMAKDYGLFTVNIRSGPISVGSHQLRQSPQRLILRFFAELSGITFDSNNKVKHYPGQGIIPFENPP